MDVHVKKTVPIEFKMVVDAYAKVRKGGKAVGVDKESWEEFDKDLQGNLYVIWNRLASGSYYPSAVRTVEIPKKDGKMRKLGIPTLRDRIAQCVVKDYMEVRVDQHFHKNSYGYRPLKSGKEAIEQVRKNCKKYAWVIDLDISKFFDEIDHELMMKGVGAMIEESWVKMYVRRWLEMKIEQPDGTLQDRKGQGTPQGGVISPLLANIYLHYALDKWLELKHPEVSFVRYADDMVIHCHTKAETEQILQEIRERLSKVKLRLNETKTKIVYCKDYKRKQQHEQVQFNFLGYSFQPRRSKSYKGTSEYYLAYTAEISKDNQTEIKEAIREAVNWWDTSIQIEAIAGKLNSKLRGWIYYFGAYSKRALRRTLGVLESRLVKWVRNKYKITSIRKANAKLMEIRKERPRLFYHWQEGYC
jgi:group II intron reverse transcriptase/maturase